MVFRLRLLILPVLLLCAAGCNRNQFPDICTLDKAHLPFGTAVRVRAVVSGGFGIDITGRGCAKSIAFIVYQSEWDPLREPAELIDRMGDAFRESVRRNQNLAVEADLILELSRYESHGIKIENPPAAIATIKGAKNFALVPSPYQ